MKRRILVLLEQYDYAKTAIEYGIRLASDCDCELTGLSIIDTPSIEKSIGPVPVGGGYYALKEQELRKQEESQILKKIMDEFSDICVSKQIDCKLLHFEGEPGKIIIDISRYYDLIIMGRKTSCRYGNKEDKHLHHYVISHGICPVFVIPDTFRKADKILLCYDGHVQSAKAIHHFVQMGSCRDRQLTLLTINNDQNEGKQLLDDMEKYLQSYDLSAEKVCLQGNPKKIVWDFMHEKNMDMVVMGAYGHRGVVSFFIGSTTDTLLKDADRPMLIYH